MDVDSAAALEEVMQEMARMTARQVTLERQLAEHAAMNNRLGVELQAQRGVAERAADAAVSAAA